MKGKEIANPAAMLYLGVTQLKRVLDNKLSTCGRGNYF
jgi:hypothetical protein